MENLDASVWKLLHDDQFIKWVYSPDEDTMAYWKKWMEDHPDKVPQLMQAREIVTDLAAAGKPEEIQQMADAIWAGVQREMGASERLRTSEEVGVVREMDPLKGPGVAAGGNVIPMSSTRPRRSRKIAYWAAASLLILVAAGGIKYLLPHRRSIEVPALTQPVATVLIKKDLQHTNRTAQPQEVWLVDGSRVILQPGARIRHATFLQKDKREVYLEGNAFFEVASDAARPFHVYTKDLIVKVLGTSFNVSTNKDNGDVTVLVRSGKVAVSKNTNPAHEQLILETNQRVLYNEQTHDLVQTSLDKIAARPEEIPQVASTSFVFDEAPVVEIFQTLEKAYGIPLFYDKKIFSSCQVTTSLTTETFEEKLRIICEAIGASYKMADSGIYIDGKPCK